MLDVLARTSDENVDPISELAEMGGYVRKFSS